MMESKHKMIEGIYYCSYCETIWGFTGILAQWGYCYTTKRKIKKVKHNFCPTCFDKIKN